ncbi:hypothetical protein CEXT_503941 [Caerostris extrusa]|uniref:Uncharacterized protein n=1 Tax=Caerostris extrusa TaxID=172846 RepID=A0AAV4Y680_CAEEX|nr:hypothetical protein CEXT_503941 [Caerostris extrusa]
MSQAASTKRPKWGELRWPGHRCIRHHVCVTTSHIPHLSSPRLAGQNVNYNNRFPSSEDFNKKNNCFLVRTIIEGAGK